MPEERKEILRSLLNRAAESNRFSEALAKGVN